jgi:hypothetical protein
MKESKSVAITNIISLPLLDPMAYYSLILAFVQSPQRLVVTENLGLDF